MFKPKLPKHITLEDNPQLSSTYRAVENWCGDQDKLALKLGRLLQSELWATGTYSGRRAVKLCGEEALRATEALERMYEGFDFHLPALSGMEQVLQWNIGDRIQAAAILGKPKPILEPSTEALPPLGAPRTIRIPEQRRYSDEEVLNMIAEEPNLRALLNPEQKALFDTVDVHAAA
ncbi:MAG TPA: hypothetical protein VLG13_02065 [Patescibacteria group bacterium]|nr:hypothetical protein [Patescibacteria group bacterium]